MEHVRELVKIKKFGIISIIIIITIRHFVSPEILPYSRGEKCHKLNKIKGS